ncbi:UNVERIFIED_CONTAM: hypothetical protein FKN15_070399 [Acipenser sinensis]
MESESSSSAASVSDSPAQTVTDLSRHMLEQDEDDDLEVFSKELASHKKQGPSLLSRMGETVRAVAASVRGVQNRPEEFTAMNDYVETFGQKMGMLDKITQRTVKEQKEYLEGMKACGPVYTLWSGSEDQLVEPLKAIAGCIDNCCKVTEEQVAGLSENQVPILHEYVLCAETLKAVLRRRDNIQAEYESKVDALANKKADKENVSSIFVFPNSDVLYRICHHIGNRIWSSSLLNLQIHFKVQKTINVFLKTLKTRLYPFSFCFF